MPEDKKENTKKAPATDKQPRQVTESSQDQQNESSDISIVSRLASQISDDGTRQEKKKDDGN